MTESQYGSSVDTVRDSAHQMVKSLHDSIRAKPNHLTSEPTLTRLGSRKRAVEKAIKEGRHVQPEVFASLLELAPGLSYEEKIEHVQKYTAAMMSLEADKCIQILQRVLRQIGPDGETVTILDYETHVTVRGRSVSISRSNSVSVNDDEARAEFLAAQRAVIRGSAFGWITNVGPGFQITAPSRAICGLLDLGYDELNGSFLLADPLRTRLQNILGNFGEWALIIGMLTNTALADWRSDPGYAHSAAEVGKFFEWLKWYVKTDYKNVADQVDLAPAVLVDGDSSRNDLRQCLAAALGDAEWPAFNLGRHNTMRVYVARHPMLAEGVARFEKIARPFYSAGRVLGYEVTWSAEYADETANGLMRSVLAELGIVQKN